MLLYLLVFDPNQFFKYCFSLFTFHFFFTCSLQQKNRTEEEIVKTALKRKVAML